VCGCVCAAVCVRGCVCVWRRSVSAGGVERAAAVAVFHGALAEAVHVLQSRALEIRVCACACVWSRVAARVSLPAFVTTCVFVMHAGVLLTAMVQSKDAAGSVVESLEVRRILDSPSCVLCHSCDPATLVCSQADLLGLVAMTIAGFPASMDASQLWLTLTRALCARLADHHPYLHAVCCFLREQLGDGDFIAAGGGELFSSGLLPVALRAAPSSAASTASSAAAAAASPDAPRAGVYSGAYALVLNNVRIDLPDRVAFACRFLDNEQVWWKRVRAPAVPWLRATSLSVRGAVVQLAAYLAVAMQHCMEHASIEGLVLTGMCGDGVRLVQAYVDRTGTA
jgi:hypothetical protein